MAKKMATSVAKSVVSVGIAFGGEVGVWAVKGA